MHTVKKLGLDFKVHELFDASSYFVCVDYAWAKNQEFKASEKSFFFTFINWVYSMKNDFCSGRKKLRIVWEVVSQKCVFHSRLWDIECGACLRVLEGHEELVRCIRFDNKRIVSGAYDGYVFTGFRCTVYKSLKKDRTCCMLSSPVCARSYTKDFLSNGGWQVSIRWAHSGPERGHQSYPQSHSSRAIVVPKLLHLTSIVNLRSG